MSRFQGFWIGFVLAGVVDICMALWPAHGRSDIWLLFPLVLAAVAAGAGGWLAMRRSALLSWPVAAGLLCGFTVVSSIVVKLLVPADNGSDINGANYILFAPWIALFACAPAIGALHLARFVFRLRIRP